MNASLQKPIHEIWSAILMSLTALVTAWCAYQANLWDSNQSVELALALDNQTLHSKELLSSEQHRMMDGIIALEVAKAVASRQVDLAQFFTTRVREDLRIATQAWIALDPLNNSAAPPHALLMPSYIQNVTEKSLVKQRDYNQKVEHHLSAAQVAGGISDSYVLLTVLFSVVLFFTGISSTFQVTRVQTGLIVIATCVFIVSIIKMGFLKIALG